MLNSKKSMFDYDAEEERAIFVARCKQLDMQLPSEEACVDALFKMIHSARPIQCTRCFSTEVSCAIGDRKAKCNVCSQKINFTVGTGFEGKKKIRERFAAILLKEEGLFFSKLQFSKQFNISYSTAWQMIVELDLVLAGALINETTAINIESALFQSCVGKRSVETPAREHPWAEQKVLEQQQYKDGAASGQNSGGSGQGQIPYPTRLNKLQKTVFNALKQGPVLFDDLLNTTGLAIGRLSEILLLLELDGFVAKLAGDMYGIETTFPKLHNSVNPRTVSSLGQTQRSKSGRRKTVMKIAQMAFRISQTMHGVSRKFLQAHVANYWCAIDRKRWVAGALLSACLQSARCTIADMRAFVSPLVLTVVLV